MRGSFPLYLWVNKAKTPTSQGRISLRIVSCCSAKARTWTSRDLPCHVTPHFPVGWRQLATRREESVQAEDQVGLLARTWRQAQKAERLQKHDVQAFNFHLPPLPSGQPGWGSSVDDAQPLFFLFKVYVFTHTYSEQTPSQRLHTPAMAAAAAPVVDAAGGYNTADRVRRALKFSGDEPRVNRPVFFARGEHRLKGSGIPPDAPPACLFLLHLCDKVPEFDLSAAVKTLTEAHLVLKECKTDPDNRPWISAWSDGKRDFAFGFYAFQMMYSNTYANAKSKFHKFCRDHQDSPTDELDISKAGDGRRQLWHLIEGAFGVDKLAALLVATKPDQFTMQEAQKQIRAVIRTCPTPNPLVSTTAIRTTEDFNHPLKYATGRDKRYCLGEPVKVEYQEDGYFSGAEAAANDEFEVGRVHVFHLNKMTQEQRKPCDVSMANASKFLFLRARFSLEGEYSFSAGFEPTERIITVRLFLPQMHTYDRALHYGRCGMTEAQFHLSRPGRSGELRNNVCEKVFNFQFKKLEILFQEEEQKYRAASVFQAMRRRRQQACVPTKIAAYWMQRCLAAEGKNAAARAELEKVMNSLTC